MRIHAAPCELFSDEVCCSPQDSVHGSKTVDPVRYTPLVFERLRGLLMCDGLPMPEDKKLTKPEELSALQFLNEVCPCTCGQHATHC